MAEPITLRIITPERVVLDESADYVQVPALDGSMGILSRHAPLVAALGAGELTYSKGSSKQSVFVAGGFVEVRDNTVRVVSDASEPIEDIDVDRATKAAERARERLQKRKTESDGEVFDTVRAEASLRRAMMRQFVANRARR
jgi:F-type H+-transporting ATPase subunit epsilon